MHDEVVASPRLGHGHFCPKFMWLSKQELNSAANQILSYTDDRYAQLQLLDDEPSTTYRFSATTEEKKSTPFVLMMACDNAIPHCRGNSFKYCWYLSLLDYKYGSVLVFFFFACRAGAALFFDDVIQTEASVGTSLTRYNVYDLGIPKSMAVYICRLPAKATWQNKTSANVNKSIYFI